MSSVASILNRHEWKHFRPGENDASFQFTGPGVVVLAEEVAGSSSFAILDVLAAENDALTVAKRLLSQPRPNNEYRFAMLSAMSSRQERHAVVSELSKFRRNDGDS